MKVVLRDHVEHLGRRGDVVTVAAGYARNYLVPKGLAMSATPGNMKVLEQERRVWAVKETKEVGDAQQIADRIAAIELSVTKKAGESGTLYGSVTNSEVAELLGAKGIEIDRRRILIADPIKTLGDFTIPVKLHREVMAEVKLHVEGQQRSTVEPEFVQPETDDDDDEDLD